jgi:hypothetical protein
MIKRKNNLELEFDFSLESITDAELEAADNNIVRTEGNYGTSYNPRERGEGNPVDERIYSVNSNHASIAGMTSA